MIPMNRLQMKDLRVLSLNGDLEMEMPATGFAQLLRWSGRFCLTSEEQLVANATMGQTRSEEGSRHEKL
jgi:hypothetical protein